MFGRIRASPSPVELLELERFPSKIYKDDSLSIYEATLAKLKQGSQLSLSSEDSSSPTSQDSMNFELNSNASDDSDSPKVSGLFSGQALPACNGDNSCTGVFTSPNQKQKRGREKSIQFLFSKYANSHPKKGLSSFNNGSARNVSAGSSDFESTGCSKLKF